jgi:hypothetical protein
MFLAGASLAWNEKTFDEKKLVPILSRDVFADPSGKIARVAFRLGFAHRRLKIKTANETPLGTVIAAPPAEERELFCRNGLNWFKRIQAKDILDTLKEIEEQIAILNRMGRRNAVPPRTNVLLRELDMAARMAAQSCRFMLWQQAMAKQGRVDTRRRPDAAARRPYQQLARAGIHELQKLEKDFDRYWALRNKATPKHCSAFLRWRINDYRQAL